MNKTVNFAGNLQLYSPDTKEPGKPMYLSVRSKAGSTKSSKVAAALDVVENTTAQYYEWDVTEAVLAAIKKGESAISFRVQDRYAVKNEKGAGVLIQFQAKESPYGKKPQLVIQNK